MSLFSQLYRQDTAGTTLSCTGLDGDRHGLYVIRYKFWFAGGGTSPVLSMRVNNDSTSGNYESERYIDYGAPSATSPWLIGSGVSLTSDMFISGKLEVHAARTIDGNTVRRTYHGASSSLHDSGTLDHATVTFGGGYRDNSSNLTSLDIVSSAANIEVGSYVLIEQLTADNALL